MNKAHDAPSSMLELEYGVSTSAYALDGFLDLGPLVKNSLSCPSLHEARWLVLIFELCVLSVVHITTWESYTDLQATASTYGHRYWKARDPVRSPLVKPVIGGLVVGSVTTSEYPLLYVFDFWQMPIKLAFLIILATC